MGKKDEVKLLGIWASPFSRRIEMALKFKGVPYEYLEEDLENKSSLLLALSPIHEKVPVLVHNGKAIIESHVILEYIDETWKHNPILPQDPFQRSISRVFAKLVDEQIVNVGLISLAKTEKGRDILIQQTRELIKCLEKELAGKDYYGGETVGFLDFVAGSMIPFCLERAWEGMGVEIITEKTFPEYNKWVKKLKEVEIVVDCIPPREKHIEHMNNMAEKIRSAYFRRQSISLPPSIQCFNLLLL